MKLRLLDVQPGRVGSGDDIGKWSEYGAQRHRTSAVPTNCPSDIEWRTHLRVTSAPAHRHIRKVFSDRVASNRLSDETRPLAILLRDARLPGFAAQAVTLLNLEMAAMFSGLAKPVAGHRQPHAESIEFSGLAPGRGSTSRSTSGKAPIALCPDRGAGHGTMSVIGFCANAAIRRTKDQENST